MSKNLTILICGMLCLLGSSMAMANPYELSYGGRLTESSGKPLAGPVDLRVTFFRSATGNDQVAVTLADFAGVTLQEGLFQIPLSLSAAKVLGGPLCLESPRRWHVDHLQRRWAPLAW